LAGEGREGRRILVRLNAGGKLCFLLSEHANDASSDFVMNDCFVVFADDVDAKFLIEEVSMRGRDDWRGGSREEGCEERMTHTTISLVLSSNGSDSAPSALSLSPLMKVPFELFTSLM
jgi:hypothetical protein